jgi:hypothetical protein
MDDLTRQQLLLLPERQAVETQRDIGIRAALAWLLAGMLAVGAVAAIVFAAQRQWPRLVLTAVAVGLVVLLMVVRRKRFFVDNTRPLLVSFLVIEFGIAVLVVDTLPVVVLQLEQIRNHVAYFSHVYSFPASLDNKFLRLFIN